MCAALQSIDFDKRFHGNRGYGIFRRGKIVTVRNQRCLSSNPSVGNGRFMKRPYEENHHYLTTPGSIVKALQVAPAAR